MQEFFEHIKATKSTGTANVYTDRGGTYLEHFLELRGLEIETAPLGILDEFIVWLINERSQAATSVRTTWSGASQYLKWRRRRGLITPDFHAPALPRVKQEKDLKVLLRNSKQIALYLEAIDEVEIKEPLATMFRIWPFCGLRISEMIKMRRKDVGVASVDVVRNGVRASVEWTTFHVVGKGDKVRQVPLLPPGLPALSVYVTTWLLNKPGPWLWPSATVGGKRVHKITAGETLMKVRERIGIKLTPHGLRRTYCTMLLRRGVPLETVRLVMGHEDIRTTSRFYAFLEDEDVLRDMDVAL